MAKEAGARPTVLRHVAAYGLGGLVAGVLEPLLGAPPGHRAVAVAFGMAVAGTGGLVAGVLAAAAARGLGRWGRTSAMLTRLRRDYDRCAHPRDALVRLHAVVIAGALHAAVSLAVLRAVLARVWAFDDDRFARGLVVVVVSVAALVSWASATLVARALERPLRWIDARAALPLPPWPAARFALFVAIPIGAFTLEFSRAHEASLGVLAYAVPIVVLALAGGFLARLGAEVPASPRIDRVASAVLVCALAASWYSTRSWERRVDAAVAVDRGRVTGPLADLLRAATDVDRDGSGAVLGGRDCAPFDRRRSPRRVDVPGNGIDENCDGEDAEVVPSGVRSGRRWSDRLPRELVRPWNVVWVVIDAVRYDRTTLSGYGRPTTPFIEELGREGLVYTRAYAQSSATGLSIPSMLSGLSPGGAQWEQPKSGRVHLSPAHPTLPVTLAEQKWTTGLVANAYVIDHFDSVVRGFRSVADIWTTKKQRVRSERSAVTSTARALELFAAEREGPFFAFVYYESPHAPYVAQKSGVPEFPDDEQGRYESEIAYADRSVGFLLDALRADPELWASTVVVVTSDHGEEFQEHGGRHHARTCHVESVHVPLVVRVPGLDPGRIDAPVALIDIVPTLLELVGHRDSMPVLHGQSLLVPALEPSAVDPERPIFCAVVDLGATKRSFFRRSVRAGSWALFQDVGRGAISLYDVRADPGETQDVGRSRPDETRRLRRLLRGDATGNLAQLE